MAVISVAYALIAKFLHIGQQDFKRSLVEGFFSSFLSLIQQGSNDLGTAWCMRRKAGRILFFIVNVGSYFVFALYTCDLTAMMTAGIPSPPLSTFKDVFESGLTLAYVGGSLEESSILASAENGTYMQKVHLEQSKGMGSFKDVIEEVRKSKGQVVGFLPSLISADKAVKLKPLMQFADAVPIHGGASFSRGSDLVEPMYICATTC